jgi:UDP:flavonoid glycosyltransferase YjiC (YdhE family)
MRVTLLAVGSRGDLQPYLALGLALRARGHSVRVVTSHIYRRLVEDTGLTCVPLSFDPHALERGDRSGPGFRTALFDGLVETTKACEGSDALLYSHIGLAGHSIAERDGILGCQVLMHPQIPAVPGRPGHLLHYHAFLRMIWLLCRGTVNRWRTEVLGLAPQGLFPERDLGRSPILFAYSPSAVPAARRRVPRHEVTGAWFLDTPATWQPPAGVAAFLEAGPPPVYVAFERISQRADAARGLRVVLGALARAGARALVDGCGELPPSDDLLAVSGLPHDWLFPRVAAVVHHGGAGTTMAALRAGAASVVVPAWADQPYWAYRTNALGAGIGLPAFDRIDADRLGAALGSVLHDARHSARARVIAGRIAAEDGVSRAARLVEEWA